jgi:hypothetical protein
MEVLGFYCPYPRYRFPLVSSGREPQKFFCRPAACPPDKTILFSTYRQKPWSSCMKKKLFTLEWEKGILYKTD